MDRFRAATLAFALSLALTSPALACRDAQDGKPWRPEEAKPGTTAMIVAVASGSKGFVVGAARPDRVHLCARMALSDAKDQSGFMGLYLWSRSKQDFYIVFVRSGKLIIDHQLYGKVINLVPPTAFAAASNGDDQMLEIDVKANDTGADVQIDGQRVANVIARPPADAKWYGLLFQAPDRPSSFRLGPVLAFGDGRPVP